jgi:hypothetical protein
MEKMFLEKRNGTQRNITLRDSKQVVSHSNSIPVLYFRQRSKLVKRIRRSECILRVYVTHIPEIIPVLHDPSRY